MKKQLLEAILSEVMADARKLPDLLKYLFEYSEPYDAEALKRERLLDLFYPEPRHDSDDSKKFEASLRQLKSKLRERLDRFQALPVSKRLSLRVELQEGKDWCLRFYDQSKNVKRFWAPYVESALPVLIIYPELLFYRSVPGRYFVRHLDINDSVKDDKTVCPIISDNMQPAWSFVSCGDSSLVIQLTKWFERNGIETDYAPANLVDWWSAPKHRNLILTGAQRNVPAIAEILDKEQFNFRIEKDRIIIRDPIPSAAEQSEYVDEFGSSGFARGILSRTYSKRFDAWLTIFASNHSRVAEGLAHYLTSEPDVQELLTLMNVAEEDDVPKRFEIIFAVKLRELEQTKRAYAVEVIAKRLGQ
jgi:hypothetical protein